MTSPNESATKQSRLPSLSTQILLGLLAGVACGIFAGDYCSSLKPIGQAFVDLLQMTVLPYVVVAIILQIGRLTWEELRRMAAASSLVLLMLWGMGALVIVVFPLALPTWKAGSFYSTSVIEVPKTTSLLEQIITPNPFHALANGIIPAIVLFSIMVGAATMGLPQKAPVLSLLETADLVLRRVTGAIVKLTPIGVFAIAASTAGTLRVDELSRLQGYLILQIVATLILVLWLVPMLISLTTPYSYTQVRRGARAIIITAFATGKVLVVIPLIIEMSREMIAEQSDLPPESAETVEAIVPLAYPFPNLGRILGLLFIPFAAWFIGDPMDLMSYPSFLATGYLTMFGSTVVGIPYLLDAQHLPADMFQLFLASGVICGRLSDAAGAMHLYAVALITPSLMARRLQFQPARLAAFIIVGVAVTAGSLISSRIYLASTLAGLQKQADVLTKMHSPLTRSPAVVLRSLSQRDAASSQFPSRVDRIRKSKTLRVGYLADNLPFSFFNETDDLVGFDVDMAHLMAEDLGMKLELVPFEFETLGEQLDRGDFDIAMSGIGVTPTRLLRMSFSTSYMDSTLAFVVKDELRRDFSSRATIQRMPEITVAVPRSSYFGSRLQKYLPKAKIELIASPREFFDRPDIDAMLAGAEAGSAWTIQYPSYSVAVPQPDVVTLPLAYAIPQGDIKMAELVDQWVALKRGQLDYDLLYNHWILGKDPNNKRRRWCIMRDVLRWVD